MVDMRMSIGFYFDVVFIMLFELKYWILCCCLVFDLLDCFFGYVFSLFAVVGVFCGYALCDVFVLVIWLAWLLLLMADLVGICCCVVAVVVLSC